MSGCEGPTKIDRAYRSGVEWSGALRQVQIYWNMRCQEAAANQENDRTRQQ